MSLLLPEDMNEMWDQLALAFTSNESVSFHLNSRVKPYRYGRRQTVQKILTMGPAMQRFAFNHGSNCANVLRMKSGQSLGPTRYFQEGLGHHCPGKTLDIVRGSDIYCFCLGGIIEYQVLSEDVQTKTLTPGEVLHQTADGNLAHDHRIVVIRKAPGWEMCFIVTFCLVKMRGALPGVWTTPARRLAPNSPFNNEENVQHAVAASS